MGSWRILPSDDGPSGVVAAADSDEDEGGGGGREGWDLGDCDGDEGKIRFDWAAYGWGEFLDCIDCGGEGPWIVGRAIRSGEWAKGLSQRFFRRRWETCRWIWEGDLFDVQQSRLICEKYGCSFKFDCVAGICELCW